MKQNISVMVFLLTLTFINPACNGDGNTNSTSQDPKDVKNQYMVTFVELGSVRCIPCKKMIPIVEEIKKEYKDRVKVVFHDVWTTEGKPFAEKYKIRVIPTQVFLDGEGIEYYRHEGFFPKEEIKKILKLKGVEL